jgi:hypothetical protein
MIIEGEETTDTTTTTETTATEETTVVEPTAAEKELAALKEENARLKAQPTQAQTTQTVTSATLENYTDDQWATIEARTGKDKATILRDYKDYELTTRQNCIDAKTNTTEALQDALEANPKLIKLRGAIKEFMDDVPVADKLDPAKLKRHMEKAITYAKGKHMTNTSDTPAPKHSSIDKASPKGEVDENDDDGLKDGEIKNDEYVSETGLRIKLGKVDKATWKNIQHKTRDANSVSIPADFDKPPSFK